MTIEESDAAILCLSAGAVQERANRSQLDALIKNGIGHVFAFGLIWHKTPEEPDSDLGLQAVAR